MSDKPRAGTRLFYGNQSLPVERAAAQYCQGIIANEPPDFAQSRFDGEELLRPAPKEVQAERLDALQVACASAPFLCTNYVVRLDHMEALKVPVTAVRNLRKKISAQGLVQLEWKGETVWVPDHQLPPGARPLAHGTLEHLIARLDTGADGTIRIVPTPEALKVGYLIEVQKSDSEAIDFSTFLKKAVKGKYQVEGAQGETQSPAVFAENAPSRLFGLLEGFIENPPPGLHLVLTAQVQRESELPKALLDLVRAHGSAEKFITYDDYHPVEWVRKLATELRLRLTREQAESLIQLVGNQQQRLRIALEKLCLIYPDGQIGDEESLALAIHGESGGSVFQINERLSERNLERSLAILQQFFHNTPNEVSMLNGVLARHFRQLLRARRLQDQGWPEARWPVMLKMAPFIAKKLATQVRGFSTGELEKIVQSLAALERDIRLRGTVVPLLYLNLAHRICTRRQRAGSSRTLPGR